MSNSTTKSRKPLTAKLSEINVDFSKNPRGEFSEEDIAELVASVEQRGVIQPVLCIEDEAGGLELVAGYRRFAACKVAGQEVIPFHIRDAADRDGDALTENMIRSDMTEIAEARALKRYAGANGLNQKDLAKRIGKDPSFISGRFKMLRLPESVQDVFVTGKPGISVVPTLETIAKVSEGAAVKLAEMAAGDAEFERTLRRDPRAAISNLQAALSDERGTIKTEEGEVLRPPGDGELTVIDISGHRGGVDVDELAMASDRREELLAHMEAIANSEERAYAYQNELSVYLDDADFDALRALGVLLEFESEWGGPTRYCFDSAAVLDRVEQRIETAAAEAKAREEEEIKAAREQAEKAGEDVPEDVDPAELRAQREKEERAKERAKAKKKQEKTRSTNLDLGRRLLKRRSRKRSEKRRRELVRALAIMVVEADDHLAGLGPRLTYEAWQDVTYKTLKNGETREKVTHLDPREATARLVKDLEGAKALDDVLDVIGDALVGAVYASEDELPMSRRVCGYSGGIAHGAHGPARRGIDEEATGVLPPNLETALKRSKKDGYEVDPLVRGF